MQKPLASPKLWHLYILRMENGALYTGITVDVERRLAQHREGKGAKSLRGKGELQLVLQRPVGDRSQALRLEYLIKRFSKATKERLVVNQPASLMPLLEINRDAKDD